MSDTPDLIDHPDRWGLFPERPNGEPMTARALLRHWFIHFNPLYFISASCVLYGVFLVNRSLDRLESVSLAGPQVLLFGVLQAYELLIVAGAVFLARYAKAIRPAVLLILLEAIFLFDCTLRLESILLRSPLRVELSIVWILLTLAKVWGLATGLSVPLTRRHYVSIAASGAALAAIIHLLAHPSTDKGLVLQIAAWLGAFVVIALDVRSSPPVSALAGTEERSRERAARCARGAFRLLACAYFYHVWCYLLVAASADVAWSATLPQAGTLFLYWTLVRRKDVEVWGAGLLLILAALPVLSAVPYAAFLVGAVFAYRVWRGARTGLAAGAVVFVYAGLWALPWRVWGEPPSAPALWSWPTVGLVLTLCLIGWYLRDRLAQALLAVAFVYATSAARRILPTTDMGVGILLLVVGFATFVVGLAVNWRLRAGPLRRRVTSAD